MTLFDTLIVRDAVPKVVDLWHVSYGIFFERALDLGFFEEACKLGIEPLILLHTDWKERFVDAVGTILARWPGLDLTLVHNEGLVELRGESRVAPGVAQQPLVLPNLDTFVQRVLEEPEIFVHRLLRTSSPDALVLRIREALTPVFDQFRLLQIAREVGLPARSLLPPRPSWQTGFKKPGA